MFMTGGEVLFTEEEEQVLVNAIGYYAMLLTPPRHSMIEHAGNDMFEARKDFLADEHKAGGYALPTSQA